MRSPEEIAGRERIKEEARLEANERRRMDERAHTAIRTITEHPAGFLFNPQLEGAGTDILKHLRSFKADLQRKVGIVNRLRDEVSDGAMEFYRRTKLWFCEDCGHVDKHPCQCRNDE